MKITALLLVLGLLLVGSPGLAEETNQAPQTEEMKIKNELAKRASFKQLAYAKMDKMVGTFVGTGMIDGLELELTLITNPKTINDLYYHGSYTLKDKEGKILYEAATVLTFNTGGMSYFMFFFGGDEYIRSAFGTYEKSHIQLASPMPQGIEFYRFTNLDDDTLKLEKWDAVPNIGNPKGDPESVVTLKKVK